MKLEDLWVGVGLVAMMSILAYQAYSYEVGCRAKRATNVPSGANVQQAGSPAKAQAAPSMQNPATSLAPQP